MIIFSGSQKADFMHPVIASSDRLATTVNHYFNQPPSDRGGHLRGYSSQALLVTDGRTRTPWMWFPSQGFVKHASGRDDLFGWADPIDVCAAPFATSANPWATRPAKFSQEGTLILAGFLGRLGFGRELEWLLAAPDGKLTADEVDHPWRLYQLAHDGEISIEQEGAGAGALLEALADRDVSVEQVALNCGLREGAQQ